MSQRCGVPKSVSKTSGSSAPAWGGTRRSLPRRCRRRRTCRERRVEVHQARDVVQESQVAHEGDRRRPGSGVPAAHTQRGRDDAVDAVGATVGQDAGRNGCGAPYHSRSRMGMDAETTIGGAVAGRVRVEQARHVGFAEVRPGVDSMAACAASSMASHDVSQAGSAGCVDSIAAASHSSVSQWWNSVATRVGSVHWRQGSSTTTRAPCSAAPGTHTHPELWRARVTRGAPPSQVEAAPSARWHRRRRCAGEPTTRAGIGQHRPPQAFGQRLDELRVGRSGSQSADDDDAVARSGAKSGPGRVRRRGATSARADRAEGRACPSVAPGTPG